MNRNREEKMSFRTGIMSCRILLVLLAGCVILVGCEHRISMNKFLEMQEEQKLNNLTDPENPENLDSLGDDSTGDLTEISTGNVSKVLPMSEPFRLTTGDVVLITIIPAEQTVPPMPFQVRVHSNGEIQVPLAGAVGVGNVTLEEAESAIRSSLVPEYHRQVVVYVQVVDPVTTDVVVIGAVMMPGLVNLRQHERNLLVATATAGRSTADASGLVTLRRFDDPDHPEQYNLYDPRDLRRALALAPLSNGDIVEVHSGKSNTVFIGGLVNVSGPQTYPAGTRVTALQALAAAGGTRSDLVPTEATLIRRIGDDDVHVKLDLFRLVTGRDKNIELAAGDILWVPHTVWTRAHELANNTISLRATANYGAYFANISSERRGDEAGPGRDTVIVNR